MVINKDYIDVMLDAAFDVRALLNACECALFKNNLAPTCLSVLGDFDEADFTGYGVTNPTFGAATVGTCVATLDAGNQDFVQTGVLITNNIYGYWLYHPVDNNWVIAERNVSAPVAMNAAGYTYRVALKFKGQEIP